MKRKLTLDMSLFESLKKACRAKDLAWKRTEKLKLQPGKDLKENKQKIKAAAKKFRECRDAVETVRTETVKTLRSAMGISAKRARILAGGFINKLSVRALTLVASDKYNDDQADRIAWALTQGDIPYAIVKKFAKAEYSRRRLMAMFNAYKDELLTI